MAIYFHRVFHWMTADSAEELAMVGGYLGLAQEQMKDGYYELTQRQRTRASHLGGGSIDDATFQKLVERLNKEIEI